MVLPLEVADGSPPGGGTVHCGACRRPNRPAARYCDQCGTPLGNAPRPTRKVVSVVFGDLVGSTSLQENLDPESAALVMGRYYEAMRATVREHGGHLEKFVGDGVVAVFGADRLGEDDALRATRCAASMLGALETISAQTQRTWGIRLLMRVGVHTGELVVGKGQELVGDTMNTAARLEQAAPVGEVLVGEATRRLVRHHVVLKPIAPLTLRGKSVPLRAWRLLSPAPGRRPDDVLEAPLIGRSGLLDRLLAALDTVIESGAPGLVTVIGAPGMGKSRLLHEFVAAVAARDGSEHIAVVHARCEPSDAGCRSMADILRRAAGPRSEPGAHTAARATSVGSHEPEAVSDEAEGLGGGWDPGRPVALVIDDVHQAEPSLRRLIGDRTRRPGPAPVLVVAAARPQLRNLDEPLVTPRADGQEAEVMELAALTPDQSHRMVRELLGRAVLPAPFVARVVATSEGNPLFLTELVRMLVDEHMIVRSAEGWVCHKCVGDLDVPPTVHQIVGARLERLTSDERFTLECAAVIGRVFTVAAVRTLVGAQRSGDLERELSNLRLRELIEPLDPSGMDGEYRFLSDVVRDTAYALLLKQTRAELHEVYGRQLLDCSTDERHRAAARWHMQQAQSYREQLGGTPQPAPGP